MLNMKITDAGQILRYFECENNDTGAIPAQCGVKIQNIGIIENTGCKKWVLD